MTFYLTVRFHDIEIYSVQTVAHLPPLVAVFGAWSNFAMNSILKMNRVLKVTYIHDMGIFPICKVGPVIFCGSWRLIIVHIIHTILALTLKLFNTSSGPTFMPDFLSPWGP